MSGKDAIIEKIKEDARIKVNSTLEEGSATAQRTIETANNDADIYKRKNMSESYAEREEILRRAETVAGLEVKKIVLQAKKRVIDKAFDEAVKKIKSDREGYMALIERMLSFAGDGETIVISASDKEAITAEFIAKVTKKQGKKVFLAKEYGDFCGGIKICSEGTDKNLTLEAELAEIRRNEEPHIAQMIFGE